MMGQKYDSFIRLLKLVIEHINLYINRRSMSVDPHTEERLVRDVLFKSFNSHKSLALLEVALIFA